MSARQRVALWYAVVMVFLSIGVAVGVNIWYTQRVAAASRAANEETVRETSQKWCKIVTTLDNAYRAQPPTSPTGRQLAQDMHQLRIDLDCKE